MLDLTDTVVPKSDQLNADDLLSGARTFTIKAVRKTGAEQPVAVDLVEFPDGRPYLPCKSMRRVMMAAWGPDASVYPGRRMTLYRDPAVRFGGLDVGGLRISHLSHIPKPLSLALTVTRGKRAPYVVQPLPDDAPTSSVVSDESLAELVATFDRKGIPEDARLSGVNRIISGSATDLECITEDEARRVLAALRDRPDQTEADS
jgi:hypothetical protein